MPRNERHVVPNSEGGWDVKKPGSPRASSHHGTQAGAEQRAKERGCRSPGTPCDLAFCLLGGQDLNL